LKTRVVDAGFLAKAAAGRTGRRTNSPPQLGHTPCRHWATQSAQKVHSNEQIMANGEVGGKSMLQHSQLGRS
jgi:hypothetical protein